MALRQAVALELDALVVALRDHPLVGGELAFDLPRDEQPLADVEEQVVLALFVLNGARRPRRAGAQFHQRLLRDDHLELAASSAAASRGTVTSASRCPSVATSVIVVLEDELGAVQEIPRVFARDRELRPRHHVPERLSRQGRHTVPDASGTVGKSSRGSVCIFESNRSAATFTLVLSCSIRTSVSGSAGQSRRASSRAA